MSWAEPYIQFLKQGNSIYLYPRANALSGRIPKHQLCELTPIKRNTHINPLDIVLCEVEEKHHFAIVHQTLLGRFFLIGYHEGRVIGWTSKKKIFGKFIDRKK